MLTGPRAQPVTVLAVGGTGESWVDDHRTDPAGMLAAVTEALDDRFVARWVPYPASYGPSPRLAGDDYQTSVAAGVAALSAAIDTELAADPAATVMLIGYSQGAVVIRHLLAQQHIPAVAAVGFVADPHQPPGVVAGCSGWGVAGPGPDLPSSVPAYWVGTSDDVICNASPDSLIRDVADLSEGFSVRTLGRWAGQAWNRVRAADLQNAAATAVRPSQWRKDIGRLAVAAREVRGYLPSQLSLRGLAWANPLGGRHVSYDSEPYRRAPLTDPDTTGCENLAHWLQVQVTLGAPDPTGTAA
ncbi:PE-PPE domain-containing protein [Gordonia alkaliphila]|uniref:PE-PPE domain-containing protein n=1 Tax=Gordonia alkaliphila TaxID=1053547 RepID=UPI001FF4B786|nr:PE-PPE domain-containing protein [Gordonia alkaliphila]MCK0440281.1 PE-PPE domain-containing protein [Gordonia alkaliphila]